MAIGDGSQIILRHLFKERQTLARLDERYRDKGDGADLAAGLASAAAEAAGLLGATTVLLAGGCFQNRLLLELTATALRGAGLVPRWAEQLPSNDGGLALGQLWAALADLPITK